MNPEVKDKWTKALRSGEYPQTDSCLKDDKGFCCLGVLTDLAIKDGVIGPWFQLDDDTNSWAVVSTDEGVSWDETAILPYQVAQWAGLDSRNPMVFAPGEEYSSPISDPNDSGVPFSKIADIIEEQL